jgi:hypothetical protein
MVPCFAVMRAHSFRNSLNGALAWRFVVLVWSVSVKDALELILRRAQGQLDQTSFAMIVSSLQQGVNNTSLDAWSAESDLAALLVREPQLSEEVCTYGSIECYEL